jgi:hypothetical protein
MAALVGHPVRVPRAVFAADIRRKASKEPPNGTYLEGTIIEYAAAAEGAPFAIVLIVADEDGELVEEEVDASLGQVRVWIAELLDGEDRQTLGQPEGNKTRARKAPSGSAPGQITSKKRARPLPARNIFASPAPGQR